MSIRATNWAWGVEGLTAPEAFVLVSLADHHNGQTGLCCPSNERLAERTRFKLTAVKAAIAGLIRKGLVAVYPGKGRARRLFVLAITDSVEQKSSGGQERSSGDPAHIEPEFNQNARERASLDLDLKEDIPPAVRECVTLLRGGQRERDLSHRFGADEIAQARKLLVAARRPDAMGLMRSIAPETKKPAGSGDHCGQLGRNAQ